MTNHPAPILGAQPCPASMLPRAAALIVKRAEAAGWTTKATIALGFRVFGRHDSEDYRPVRSVMVRASQVQGIAQCVVGYWIGDLDGTKMKFDGAWRYPGRLGIPDRLSAEELKAAVS